MTEICKVVKMKCVWKGLMPPTIVYWCIILHVFAVEHGLGYLYNHGHLSRAVCCRVGKDPEGFPDHYRLNHPRLGSISIVDALRETEKTKPTSLNWCYGDSYPEVTDGTTGQCTTSRYSTKLTIMRSNLFS